MSKKTPIIQEKRISAAEIIIGACVIAVFILNFRYVDMDSTTAWGLDFWDSVLHGRFAELYPHAAENVYGAYHKAFAGTLLHYIVLAVPVLPLWIAKSIFGFDVLSSFGSMIYVKLIYAAAFALILYGISQICTILKFKKNDIVWTMFLCATSSFAIIPLFAFGQYDVYVLLLVVFGLLFLMRGKPVLFAVLFAFAAAIKPFALLVYIPVLLLKEKKIVRILQYCLPIVGVYAFFSLVSLPFPGYTDAMASSEGNASIIGGMLSSEIPMSFGSVSLFITAFAALSIFAYIRTVDEKNENECLIYFSLLALSLYFIFGKFQGYRIIMLVPFLYIVIMMNKDRFRLTLAADMIAGIGFSCAVPLYEVWSMQNMKGYSDGLSGKLSPIATTFQALIGSEAASGKQSVSHYLIEVLASMFIFGIAAIVILCAPAIKNKIVCHRYCACVDKPLVWLRVLIPLAFIVFRLLIVL